MPDAAYTAALQRLLALWGKTHNGRPDSRKYHPLLFHLLDVGEAARGLWQLLPLYLKRRIADALGVRVAEAERVVVLLAALHDLGKASAFQAKAVHLWIAVQEAGLKIGSPSDEPHAYVTDHVLPDLLQTDVCGWTSRHSMALALAGITGAHHGRFAPGKSMSPQTLGGAEWRATRRDLATLVAEILYPGSPPVTVPRDRLEDIGVGAVLSGFISVADWVGSSKRHFPAECHLPDKGPLPVEEYAPLSHKKAAEALREFGWRENKFAPALPFAEIVWGEKTLPDGTQEQIRFAPNRMQQVVSEFADQSTGPYLMIVEAAMGDGKTEAALYAADHALTGGAADNRATGFYVALPTQATGNAMFDRVCALLTHRGHLSQANLQLLHGGATFNDAFDNLLQNANVTRRGDEDGGLPVVAESWFATGKQALLAPFGVGTIDQTLMGVLQTKHWFVRLFGLTGKVVIFDEVHAYDVYMGELLQALMRWLAELDCTVILLSATLPAARRQKLMDAYQAGATALAAPYPRVTTVPRQGAARSIHVADPAGGRTQTVTLEYAPVDYAALGGKIARDLPGGGCAGIICNTVRQAQAAYDALHDHADLAGWDVTLFHARTPQAWRKEREESLLDKFGKPTRKGVVRPAKALLIGTQVLEQSLDYDMDWMASEMAPVDLVLQRMGRLWRHARPNRPVTAPSFVVLLDPAEPDVPPAFSSGTDLIYDKYILLRSVLALRGKTAVALPADIEPLITAVYDTPPAEGLGPAWENALRVAKKNSDKEANDDESVARGSMVGRPRAGGEFLDVLPTQDKNLIDSDDPRNYKIIKASTRLTDPSLTIICLHEISEGAYVPFCQWEAGVTTLISLKRVLKPHEVKRMLESALTIPSSHGAFKDLLAQAVPPTWENDAHLRYTRYVVFDAEGVGTVGSVRLRLNKATGLREEGKEK